MTHFPIKNRLLEPLWTLLAPPGSEYHFPMKNGLLAGQAGTLDFDYYYYYYEPNHWGLQTV